MTILYNPMLRLKAREAARYSEEERGAYITGYDKGYYAIAGAQADPFANPLASKYPNAYSAGYWDGYSDGEAAQEASDGEGVEFSVTMFPLMVIAVVAIIVLGILKLCGKL